MSVDPSSSAGQGPANRKPSLEVIIYELLLGAARKAGADMEGLVIPERITEAEKRVAQREARQIITKAINYAKGIAADKKFRPHHLLKELGIKMPAASDGADNPADMSKVRRRRGSENAANGNTGEGNP